MLIDTTNAYESLWRPGYYGVTSTIYQGVCSSVTYSVRDELWDSVYVILRDNANLHEPARKNVEDLC